MLGGRDKVNLLKENEASVVDVLKRGNLFWYMLPEGYLDNGPRVIMEAMAVGLPILADNRGGAKDRVTEECGWLCNSPEDHIEIIKNIQGKELTGKGQAAKERARSEFNPMKWIDAILN
jgi:glycosyltransferase involved in cell wall biosynthesis